MSNESTIHVKNIKVLLTEIRDPKSLVSKFTTTYGIDTSFSEDLNFGKIFLKKLKILTR